MHQADATNIIKMPSPIERLWEKYQTAAAEKLRVYALSERAEALGDGDEYDRPEDACDEAYDRLADIADAILEARSTCKIDRSIQAEIIIRRERDFGGPCTGEEIEKFCRDIQTASGFVSPSEALP